MKTPIETLRKAAAKHGGLSKATEAQLRRWWRTLDAELRASYSRNPAPASPKKTTTPQSAPKDAPPADEPRKDPHDARSLKSP